LRVGKLIDIRVRSTKSPELRSRAWLIEGDARVLFQVAFFCY
jgi:hypothetical protein